MSASDSPQSPLTEAAALQGLRALGFGTFFEEAWHKYLREHPGCTAQPERVTAEWRGEYTLLGAGAPRRAMLSGRLRHELPDEALPCVGDWVLAETSAERARIEHVFARKGCFVRKVAGNTSNAQAIAANVDVAFIVCSLLEESADPFALSHALNPRRIARYLLAASQAHARAIVLMNKADLRQNAAAHAHTLSQTLNGAEVLPVSAATGLGLESVRSVLEPGVTAVLVGSSGVGKSSLLNAIAGHSTQLVGEVRSSDAHGRHTTSHRELFTLPSGAVLIDTPGMREFGLYADDEAPKVDSATLERIETLAESCRFRDCKHQAEPGCAVRAAVDQGELDAGALEQHAGLLRELGHQRERSVARKRKEQQKKAAGSDRPRSAKRDRS